MPSSAEHDEKIRRNTQAMQLFSTSSSYNEWVAVTAFYTTIHIIEKLFSDRQVKIVSRYHRTSGEPKNHKERRHTLHMLIRGGIIPHRFKRKYNTLSRAAFSARYKSMAVFNKQFGNRIPELLNIVADFRKSLP